MQIDTIAPKTKKAAKLFRAFNHPLRQQLLKYLQKNPGKTVTLIYVHFRLEQSVASQQLAILREVGLVTPKRDGKFIYYSANEERLAELAVLTEQILAKQ